MMYTDSKLMSAMSHVTDIELKPNQRLKTEKRTGITWLEEKKAWKDHDGSRHNCWVRIAVVGKEG